MSPLYTKTFGGKIWKHLHSVSPNNFLCKKFKMASLEISRQNIVWTSPRAKNLKAKRQFFLLVNKNNEKAILTSLLVEKFKRNSNLSDMC